MQDLSLVAIKVTVTISLYNSTITTHFGNFFAAQCDKEIPPDPLNTALLIKIRLKNLIYIPPGPALYLGIYREVYFGW